MTLEAAVAILNERNHRGCQAWYITALGNERIVRGEDQYDYFEPFEAIAIAEKYDAKPRVASDQSHT